MTRVPCETRKRRLFTLTPNALCSGDRLGYFPVDVFGVVRRVARVLRRQVPGQRLRVFRRHRRIRIRSDSRR